MTPRSLADDEGTSSFPEDLGKETSKLGKSAQNFAARTITGTRKFDHITPALKELRWVPIKQMLYFRDVFMAFKWMTTKAPCYLSNQFTTRIRVNGRTNRSSQLLNIPLYKSNVRQRTFYYRKVNILTNLNNSLKTSNSIYSFKVCLKDKLITDFSDSNDLC